MTDSIELKLSDFSRFPSGRDDQDGDFNGTKYRDTVLLPALNDAIAARKVLRVSIAGVLNFGSSFLEEAFGGLIRCGNFSTSDIHRYLQIVPDDDEHRRYIIVIKKHMAKAEQDNALLDR